jgi:hypothetical protein
LPGRQEFSDNLSPIGDQNPLAEPHVAKVLAQLVLEVSDTNGFHRPIVALCGYIVNVILLILDGVPRIDYTCSQNTSDCHYPTSVV